MPPSAGDCGSARRSPHLVAATLPHLGQGVDRPVEMVEQACREHDVEAVVGERQGVGVADLEELGNRAALDHVLGQLEARDAREPLRPPVGEHAGTRTDVEERGVGTDAELGAEPVDLGHGERLGGRVACIPVERALVPVRLLVRIDPPVHRAEIIRGRLSAGATVRRRQPARRSVATSRGRPTRRDHPRRGPCRRAAGPAGRPGSHRGRTTQSRTSAPWTRPMPSRRPMATNATTCPVNATAARPIPMAWRRAVVASTSQHARITRPTVSGSP